MTDREPDDDVVTGRRNSRLPEEGVTEGSADRSIAVDSTSINGSDKGSNESLNSRLTEEAHPEQSLENINSQSQGTYTESYQNSDNLSSIIDPRAEGFENLALENISVQPYVIDEYDEYGHRRILTVETGEEYPRDQQEITEEVDIVDAGHSPPSKYQRRTREPTPAERLLIVSTQPINTDAYISRHGNTISLVNETDPLLARRHVMHLRSKPKITLFFSRPFFPPLIFDNHVSEARDLCVAERNFLTGLKMGLALGVAAVVLYIDLRLPTTSDPEPVHGAPRIGPAWAPSLAILFFILSMLTIIASFINYIQTVASLARQEARVVTPKLVNVLLFGSAAIILATNIVVIAKRTE